MLADHVHMPLSIPPKYSVSGVAFMKGKIAIHESRDEFRWVKFLGVGILCFQGEAG